MDAIELLLTRQSDPRLIAPAPNNSQLDIIKQAALRVPDHGCLAPWQFIVVAEDARERLGEIYYQSAVAEQQDEKVINRAKELPLRAPMINHCHCQISSAPKSTAYRTSTKCWLCCVSYATSSFCAGTGWCLAYWLLCAK